MSVLHRARADLARGEPWLARDRLVGALGSHPASAAVLEALAAVQAELGHLPAAGACWWLTDRTDTDPTAAAALTAFQARYLNSRGESSRPAGPSAGPGQPIRLRRRG